MGLKFLYITYLLGTSIVARAQFNDTITHYVYYESSATFNKTNDGNSFVLNNIGRFTVDKKTVTFHSVNSWIYGEQSGVKINDDFSAAFDCDYLKKQQRFYYWGIGAYDKSYSLKINNRFQAGGGLGYTLVNTKNATLVISDGLIYERDDLDSEDGRLKYDIWRNSFRIKYHWAIHSIVALNGTAFLQPSLSSGHDNIIKSVTTLSVALKKWLRLTSSLTYNKITVTERENLLITYGVVVEKYF